MYNARFIGILDSVPAAHQFLCSLPGCPCTIVLSYHIQSPFFVSCRCVFRPPHATPHTPTVGDTQNHRTLHRSSREARTRARKGTSKTQFFSLKTQAVFIKSEIEVASQARAIKGRHVGVQ